MFKLAKARTEIVSLDTRKGKNILQDKVGKFSEDILEALGKTNGIQRGYVSWIEVTDSGWHKGLGLGFLQCGSHEYRVSQHTPMNNTYLAFISLDLNPITEAYKSILAEYNRLDKSYSDQLDSITEWLNCGDSEHPADVLKQTSNKLNEQLEEIRRKIRNIGTLDQFIKSHIDCNLKR